ncbi:PAS domain-containing protein [Aestuariispira ectoiniformans]|uniref:PAS domain-containing protein n=1 Tax=Aestuariispira ectoiniformans TaxID=2775080 RepID=UPI00223AD145|nr:PAS domain-containing protein [Aestuariispira ectoiniformans]
MMNDDQEVSGELHEVVRRELTDAGQLRSPMTRHLFEWWQSTRGGCPLRNDFDVLDHRKLIPYLHLYQILSSDEIQLRINGEAVAGAFGRSWAGRIVSVTSEKPFHADLAHYILSVAQTEKPHLCVGTLAHIDRGFVRFESIDCPLWGEDGTVSHVVGCFDPQCGEMDQDGD